MDKKENILNVLSEGMRETTAKMVQVKNGNLVARFPADMEQSIAALQKSMERKIANLQNYGDPRGKAAVWRENNTAKELSEMREHRQDCRTHWAMYLESIKAPRHLQKYVFENLKIWMKENDINSLNKNFSFDSVAVMPEAWKRGYEQVDLFGWITEYQIADLLPAAGMEIGTKVLVPQSRYEKMEGTIIGYKYFREKTNRYSRERYGRYVIWYDVKYGYSRYEHAEYKLKEISFPMFQTA